MQAIFEATLSEAQKNALTGYINCEGERQNAGPSGGTGYSDLLVVPNEVAVLIELKRVRPNAVCNSANADIIDATKFTSEVNWKREAVIAFDEFMSTLKPDVLQNLTVSFDVQVPWNNFIAPGNKGFIQNRKVKVRDYFDTADKQLDRYKESAATYAETKGAKKLYLFSVVNIAKRILTRQREVLDLSSSSST